MPARPFWEKGNSITQAEDSEVLIGFHQGVCILKAPKSQFCLSLPVSVSAPVAAQPPSNTPLMKVSMSNFRTLILAAEKAVKIELFVPNDDPAFPLVAYCSLTEEKGAELVCAIVCTGKEPFS